MTKIIRVESKTIVTVFAFIFLSCLISGCPSNRPESLAGESLREIASPAAPGSFSPRVTSRSDGSVILSWLEPQGDTNSAFRFSVWRTGAWSEPITIAAAQPISRHPSESPGVVALSDRNLIAYWSQKVPRAESATAEVNVYFALSTDGGNHWTNPAPANLLGTGEENSYPSAAVVDDTHAALIWLDARNWKKQQRMALMSRTVQTDGSVTEASVLDEDTCTCCPTSLISAGNELVAAYRGHTSDNIRDIATVRFTNGRWSGRQVVHQDHWHFPGCPVNGPSLAAKDRALAVEWFTGANEKPAVYEAFYDGAANQFANPVRIDLGKPLGRVQTAILSDHSAAAFWVEHDSGASRLLTRRVTNDGTADQPIEIARGPGFGYPHIADAHGSLLVTWADEGKTSRVRVSEVRLRNSK